MKLFILGSAVAGSAKSISVLIAMRVIQGLGVSSAFSSAGYEVVVHCALVQSSAVLTIGAATLAVSSIQKLFL